METWLSVSDLLYYYIYGYNYGYNYLKFYREKFGLFHVDFNSAQKTRTPKRSAYVYKEIAETRRIPKTVPPRPPPPPVDEVFPDDFIFGCSSASYQVEGAWDKDGIFFIDFIRIENYLIRNTHR